MISSRSRVAQDTGKADKARPAAKGGERDDEGGGPASEAEPTTTMLTFRSGKDLKGKIYAWKPKWAMDVFFGQNLTVLDPGTVIAVGDAVVATPR